MISLTQDEKVDMAAKAMFYALWLGSVLELVREGVSEERQTT